MVFYEYHALYVLCSKYPSWGVAPIPFWTGTSWPRIYTTAKHTLWLVLVFKNAILLLKSCQLTIIFTFIFVCRMNLMKGMMQKFYTPQVYKRTLVQFGLSDLMVQISSIPMMCSRHSGILWMHTGNQQSKIAWFTGKKLYVDDVKDLYSRTLIRE